MLPAQEIANAVSLLAPALVTLRAALVHSRHALVSALLCGTLMHLPVAFAYHVLAALKRFPDRLDNNMRRMDQTLQHVACVIFAYATANSARYALACALANAVGVAMLWHPITSNDRRRWIPIHLCVHLYLLPMWGTTHFAVACGSVWVGGAFFVPHVNYNYCRGWGHCVFHLALSAHSYAVAEFVAQSHKS
jgi:hypothetical protein